MKDSFHWTSETVHVILHSYLTLMGQKHHPRSDPLGRTSLSSAESSGGSRVLTASWEVVCQVTSATMTVTVMYDGDYDGDRDVMTQQFQTSSCEWLGRRDVEGPSGERFPGRGTDVHPAAAAAADVRQVDLHKVRPVWSPDPRALKPSGLLLLFLMMMQVHLISCCPQRLNTPRKMAAASTRRRLLG
jgi:hypothetical protein